MSAAMNPSEKLPALCAALSGLMVEGVRFHEARAEVKPGSDGEQIVRVTLVVDDPAPGSDTWPVETVRAIEKRARQEAWERGVEEWVYVTLVSQSEAREGDEEDPHADDALARGLSRDADQ